LHTTLPLLDPLRLRLVLLLALVVSSLSAARPAYAYDELSLQITSATAANPLQVTARCYSSDGGYTLNLTSLYRSPGGPWLSIKSQNMQTLSGGYCNNQGMTGDPRYVASLDSSWFAGGTHDHKIVAYLVRSNVTFASAETSAFLRPIAPPAWVALRGSSGASVTNERTVTASWAAVAGAAQYYFVVYDPSGAVVTDRAIEAGTTSASGITLNGAEGSYTLHVIAQSPSGPWSTATGASLTLDTTAPAAPSDLRFTTPATVFSNDALNAWAARWTLPEAAGSLGAFDYELTRPDGSVTTQLNQSNSGCGTTPDSCSYFWSSTPARNQDGLHTLRVRFRDGAGNTSAWSNPASLTLDTLAPAAPASISAPAVVNTNAVNVSFALVADAARYVLVRRNPNATLEAAFTTTDTSLSWPLGTADGSYELRVYAEDAAGNRSASERATSLVRDTVAPPTPSAPHAPALTKETQLAISWNATSDTATYYLGLTDPSGATITQSVSAPATSFAGLPLAAGDGLYRLRLLSEDAAGNRSGLSPETSVLLDTTPPARQEQAPSGPPLTREATATVSWPALTDVVTSVVTLTSPSGQTRETLVVSPTRELLLNLDAGDGPYAVTVAGRDLAGNTAQTSPVLTITLDTTGPLAPYAAPLVPNRTNALTTTISWPEVADAVAYEVWVNGALLTMVTSPTAELGGEDGETLAVRVRGIDAAGNTGDFTPAVTMAIDRTAPQVTASFVGAPDGRGASLAWQTEAGTSARIEREYGDGRVITLTNISNPQFFAAAFGQAVQGRLIITDAPGNTVAVPFGPVVPNNLALGATVEDVNHGALRPGDLLQVTLLVSNTGAADQPGVVLALPLPEGLILESAQPSGSAPLSWNLGQLAPGATSQVVLALRVAPDATGRDLTLAPTAQSSIAPLQTAVGDVAGSDSVVQPLGGALRSSLVLHDANGGQLAVGDSVQLTLTLRAEGAAFTGVSANLPLPRWLSPHSVDKTVVASSHTHPTWQIGNLPPDAVVTCTLTASVEESGVGQTFTATPQISSHQTGQITPSTAQLGPVFDPREPQPSMRPIYLALVQL
jgi:hypothetical protein